MQLRARGRAPTPALRCSTAPLYCRSSHRARSACGSYRRPAGCGTRHSCSRCRLCALNLKRTVLGMGTGPVPAVAHRLAKAGLDEPGQVPCGGPFWFTRCCARWSWVDATRAEVALDVANILVVGLGARQVDGARALVPGLPFRALREMRAGLVNVEAEDRDPRPRVEAEAGGRIGRGVGSVQGVQIIAERDQRCRVRPVRKGGELGVPARVMNGAPSKQDEGCITGGLLSR